MSPYKQTSESSYSVASEQNMDAISEIRRQLNSVLKYLLFTDVPSKSFFKEKYCLECRLKKKWQERECELINA